MIDYDNISIDKRLGHELWYTENWTDNVRFTFRVKKTLFSARTKYQQMDIVDTFEFGKVLLLDGLVMVTEKDEWIYHEMICHPAVNYHPHPEKVLIIGGGDGGTVREFAKYDFIKKIDLVEIDAQVIEQCQKFFPQIASAYADPRVNIFTEDGITFIHHKHCEYDIVVIDSTDPFGPAEGLFTTQFYEHLNAILEDNGIFVAQAESMYFFPDVVTKMYQKIQAIFGNAFLYNSFIPTYPSGFWHFITAAKNGHPIADLAKNKKDPAGSI
jgi:spermidine synthase